MPRNPENGVLLDANTPPARGAPFLGGNAMLKRLNTLAILLLVWGVIALSDAFLYLIITAEGIPIIIEIPFALLIIGINIFFLTDCLERFKNTL